MNERDKLKRRYREFFLKRRNLLNRCNTTGKWSIQNLEKYHQWLHELNGMAWLLELTEEERRELEHLRTEPEQLQVSEKIGN